MSTILLISGTNAQSLYFLNCGSDKVLEYINTKSVVGFHGIVDGITAALLTQITINVQNNQINQVKQRLDDLINRRIILKDSPENIIPLGRDEVNEWENDVDIKLSVIGSIVFDFVADMIVGLIAAAAAGLLTFNPIIPVAAAIAIGIIVSVDFLINIWSAVATYNFFIDEVGLDSEEEYDFFLDYSEEDGFAGHTWNGIKIGAIGAVSSYLDIWDSSRSTKIARVRQEQTMAFSISGTFWAIDLGTTTTDWDVIQIYDNDDGGGTSPPSCSGVCPI